MSNKNYRISKSVEGGSIFCGSLFKPDPAIEAVDLFQMNALGYGVSSEQTPNPETRNLIWLRPKACIRMRISASD